VGNSGERRQALGFRGGQQFGGVVMHVGQAELAQQVDDLVGHRGWGGGRGGIVTNPDEDLAHFISCLSIGVFRDRSWLH
jgi:hypothetical protein